MIFRQQIAIFLIVFAIFFFNKGNSEAAMVMRYLFPEHPQYFGENFDQVVEPEPTLESPGLEKASVVTLLFKGKPRNHHRFLG